MQFWLVSFWKPNALIDFGNVQPGRDVVLRRSKLVYLGTFLHLIGRIPSVENKNDTTSASSRYASRPFVLRAYMDRAILS